LVVASTAGDGFVVPEDEILAQTRTGKQALNVKDGVTAKVCKPVVGDHVAVVSENGKFLVFPLEELPEMTRGKGVRIQKYNMARGRQGTLELDGGLSDLKTFDWAAGLTWSMGGGKTRHETDLTEWLGKRAGVGKRPPYGFPKSNTFER
ncbi:MAG: DNA gyrase C-terminal beta-propeller domain-containing protein, partial [Pseudomonadota bacterium]